MAGRASGTNVRHAPIRAGKEHVRKVMKSHRGGWVYLAVIIDLFSRQIVGVAVSERMTRRLVIDALRMAWFRRRPTSGLIFHSDRGSQYAGRDLQK